MENNDLNSAKKEPVQQPSRQLLDLKAIVRAKSATVAAVKAAGFDLNNPALAAFQQQHMKIEQALGPADQHRRFLEQHAPHLAAIQGTFDSPIMKMHLDALKGFERFCPLSDEVSRHQETLRLLAGPLDDFRKLRLLDFPQLAAESARANELIVTHQQHFEIPGFLEAQSLLEKAHGGYIMRMLEQLQPEASFAKQAMRAMRSPWLDTQNAVHSATAFAELQGIGYALQHLPAFDDRVTEGLRADLGDWRDRIRWPMSIFEDLLARSSFYTERGFNPSLTDFPSASFAESLEIAGLSEAPSVPANGYTSQSETDSYDEAGFERTTAAHRRLLCFEIRVRQFIDERMTTVWGEQWIKHRIPGSMREEWHEKRRRALAGGQPEYPLIDYADFTDYMKIIIQGDNWKDIFKPIFVRKENVQESFQRLYPIRVCTMHARLITQDDELFLCAETTRILRAIAAS